MGQLIYAYDSSSGETIEEAAKEAIHHAANEDNEIALIFNDVVIRVSSCDEVAEIVNNYYYQKEKISD